MGRLVHGRGQRALEVPEDIVEWIRTLVAWEDSTGRPVPLLLVLRADPEEREALLSIGHPFFASRAGRDRIVVVLTDDTDWAEIRELVTESYRILAPKKLAALLG
jgi:hypothetical protein